MNYLDLATILRRLPPESRACTQSLHMAFLAGLAGGGFSTGVDGGQVATEALSMVFA